MSNLNPAPGPASLSVLCVDDTPVNLRVLGEMLKTCDFRVAFAGSGPEALEQMGQQHFDVVLMDIFMPGMDGIETLKQIRRLPPPVGKTPVIAVTGDQSRSRSCYLAFGFDGYQAKPVSTQPLLVEIMAALARAKGLAPLRRRA